MGTGENITSEEEVIMGRTQKKLQENKQVVGHIRQRVVSDPSFLGQNPNQSRTSLSATYLEIKHCGFTFQQHLSCYL